MDVSKKTKFKNWNFRKLFGNEIFIKIRFLTLNDEEFKKKKTNTWPFGGALEDAHA